MKKPTIRVKTGIFFLLFGTALVSILFPSILWLQNTYTFYKKEMEHLRQNSMTAQRNMVTHVAKDALRYIEHKRISGRYTSLEKLQNEILDYLASIRFENDGYIFVNQFDGQALIFEGERIYGEKSIKGLINKNGERIYDIEMELANRPDGGYMYYHFRKIGGDSLVPKISYINSVQDWEWIIGAGAYYDSSIKQLQDVQKYMVRDLNLKIARIVMLVLVFTLILAVLASVVSARLDKQFTLFHEFFTSKDSIDQTLDTDKLPVIEFKEIGAHANEMVQRHNAMQNELFKMQENLKSKTILLDNVLQSAPEIAIITTDLDYEITYMNSYTEELLSIKTEDALKKSLLELHSDIPEANSNLKNIAGHLETHNSFETVISMYREGELKYLNITASSIYSSENDLTGYLFFCSDITEKKHDEKELENHRLHLEKLVEERTSELERLNEKLREQNRDLEHFNDLFVGREFRIKELRDQVKRLEKKNKNRS